MNLEQALAASGDRLAYRVVGDRRVIIDAQGELLLLQTQRRSKKHCWLLDGEGTQVRYLDGILYNGPGRYLCALPHLTRLVSLSTYLPPHYQALLLPESNDWHAMKRGKG